MGAEEIVPEIPVKEQIKMQKRSVDRSRRALEREAKKLERERKKMLVQIKKLAEKGQTTGAKMMARDIVRSKSQQAKLEQFVGQLSAVSLRIGSCATLNELGDAMANCANAMTLVSSKLDAKKLAHMAKEIAKQDMQLDMKADMMSDILESIDDVNEEEEEEVYNQVLMEAGVNLADQLNVDGEKNVQVNNNVENKMNEQPPSNDTDDLDAMLKDLNSK
jgi:charged multivesicular body protein 2A